MRQTKKTRVHQASERVTASGLQTVRTRKSQMYAHIEARLVTAKTPTSLTFLGSGPTARIERPEMTKRLKAADPTIVDGPSFEGLASRSYTVPMTESKISGAEEPKAISVRLATVAFQIGTSIKTLVFLSLSQSSMALVCAVIASIASMKMSEMIAIPKKR